VSSLGLQAIALIVRNHRIPTVDGNSAPGAELAMMAESPAADLVGAFEIFGIGPTAAIPVGTASHAGQTAVMVRFNWAEDG
jgi:hypothetical protein